MKRKGIFMVIALVVLGSLLLFSCLMDTEEINPFKGTWLSSDGYTAIFEDSSWVVLKYSREEGLRGTYTYAKDTATVTYTSITSDGVTWSPLTSEERSRYTNVIKISGNRITWGVTTYTKQ
jgi:hypothetical protein